MCYLLTSGVEPALGIVIIDEREGISDDNALACGICGLGIWLGDGFSIKLFDDLLVGVYVEDECELCEECVLLPDECELCEECDLCEL